MRLFMEQGIIDLAIIDRKIIAEFAKAIILTECGNLISEHTNPISDVIL